MRGTPSSGDDKAISPCVLQSELTSTPLNHTMAPQDESLSEALSRRSVPLPELQRRVTRAMEVFHQPSSWLPHSRPHEVLASYFAKENVRYFPETLRRLAHEHSNPLQEIQIKVADLP